MRPTCDLHATYMRPTCDLHATYMRPTCDLHATYMRPTCDLHAVELPKRGVDGDAQALDDTAAVHGDRLEAGAVERVEILLQDWYWQDVWQVALVPLHDEWELAGAFA